MPAARRIQWAKFRVTATAVTALAILGVLLFLMTRGRLFTQWETVRVFVSDASGIVEGTPVRLNGIVVGQVSQVRFLGAADRQRVVEVELRIAHYHRSRIPADSVVSITAQNVQGEQFVDIEQGRSAKIVPPGGELRFQPTPEVLQAIDLAEFERRLRDIDALLADIERGSGSVGQMVKGTRFYRNMVDSIARAEAGLEAALTPQRTLGQLLYSGRQHDEFLASVRRLDERLAAIQRGEGPAGRLVADDRQYEDLHRRTANLRRQLADINAGRGSLGRFVAGDAQYVNWVRRVNRFVAAVDNFAAGEGAFGRLAASEQPYDSLNGMLREMRETFRDFRQDPRKYLRLDVF